MTLGSRQPRGTPRPSKPPQKRASQRRRARQRQKTVHQLRRMDVVLRLGAAHLPNLRQISWPRLSGRWLVGSGWHASKGLSLLLLLSLGLTLNWLFTDPQFYVERKHVYFENLSYLSPGELFPAAEIEDWSIFWLNSEKLARQVARHPYVAGATIQLQLPGSAHFQVQEVHPTALWLTDQGEMWVLEDGTALLARGESPLTLITIVDGPQAARRVGGGGGSAMSPALLESARTLAHTLPGLVRFRYHMGPGLSFVLPNSQTVIYWGDGLHLQKKLANLAAIQQTLQKENLIAQQIDVRFPNKPYYR